MELAQIPLEERLAMIIPSGDLEPMHLRSLSPARRRWRRAIGGGIHQLRTEKVQVSNSRSSGMSYLFVRMGTHFRVVAHPRRHTLPHDLASSLACLHKPRPQPRLPTVV